MDQKFQTSFIPKRQMPAGTLGSMHPAVPHRGTSVFMVIAVILFVVSLGAVGGIYVWKQYLISARASYQQELDTRKKQFNTDLIEQLKQVNVQIDTAKRLLANHIAVSGIFDILGKFTAQNVRFTSLDLTVNPTGGIKVSMSGSGLNLASVAFQSDVLGQLSQYGLNKIVKNPVLSNPGFGTTGAVSFGFTANVDPSTLLYESALSGTSGAQNAPPSDASNNAQTP